MNAETIKEFLVGLGFDVDETSMKKFSDGIKTATLTVVALGTAAVAAAGAITSFVSGIANKYNAIGDIADRVNTTAEEVLRLGYVASLTGSSVEASQRSMEGLNRVAGEAALGIGRGAAIFKELGLQAKDSNGNLKDTAQLMDELRSKLQGLARGEQLALLSKLGIDPTMIRALTEDISGLSEEFTAMYRSAGIDANKAAEESGKFNDSLTRLKGVMDAIKDAVGLAFMKQIRESIDFTRKWLQENMPKIIAAVKPVVDIILRIAQAFLTVVGRIGQLAGKVIDWFIQINKQTDGWAGYILAAVAAWRLLNLSFLASPLGIVLSLVAAIGLLVDDFLTWKEGGNSLIDWSDWEPGITLAVNGIRYLGRIIESVFDLIFYLGDALVRFLTGDFVGAWRVLKEGIDYHFGPIGSFVTGVLEVVMKLIGAVIALLTGDFTGAWQLASEAIESIMTGLKNFLSGIFDWIDQKLMEVADSVRNTLNNIPGYEKALGGLNSAFEWATGNDQQTRPRQMQADDAARYDQAIARRDAANTSQSVSQEVNITVNGSSNPESTGREVGNQMERVNDDMVRNLRSVAQ